MNYAQNINWNSRNSTSSNLNQNNRTNLQRTGELLMGPGSQSGNTFQASNKFGTGNFQQSTNNNFDFGRNQYGNQNQAQDLNGRKQNSYLEQNMYGNYGSKLNNDIFSGINNNSKNPNYNNGNLNNFNNKYNQLQQNLYGKNNQSGNNLYGNDNNKLYSQQSNYNLNDFKPNNYEQKSTNPNNDFQNYKQNNPYQSTNSYNPVQNRVNGMPFSVDQNPNFNYNKNYTGNEVSANLNLDAQKLMDKINKMSVNIGQYQYPNNNNPGMGIANNGNTMNSNYQKQMDMNPNYQQYSNQFPSPPQNIQNLKNINNNQQKQQEFQNNQNDSMNNFNKRQFSQTPQRNQRPLQNQNDSLNKTGDQRQYQESSYPNNYGQQQLPARNQSQTRQPNQFPQQNQFQQQQQQQQINQQTQPYKKPPVMPTSSQKRNTLPDHQNKYQNPQNSQYPQQQQQQQQQQFKQQQLQQQNQYQQIQKPLYNEQNRAPTNTYQNQHKQEHQLPAHQRIQNQQQQRQQQQQFSQQQQQTVGNDEVAAVASGKLRVPDELLQQEEEAKNERKVECPEGCGRQFREGALNVHMKACRKVFQEKRKKFDSAACRVVDEQQELNAMNPKKRQKYNPMEAAKLKNHQKGKINSKWKQKSEQFRQAMRSNKQDGDQYVPQEPYDDGLTQCPTCQRKFNDTAAKRHMPICADKNKRGQKVNRLRK